MENGAPPPVLCLSIGSIVCQGQTLVPVRELEESAGPITQVTFAPVGDTVSVTFKDPRMGWLSKFSRVSNGDPLSELPGLSEVTHTVVFAPDGDGFAWGVGPRLLSSTQSRKPGEKGGAIIHFPTSAAAFSPDGTLLAASANTVKAGYVLIRLFDAATGKTRSELRATATVQRFYEGPIQSLRFSPDGRLLYAADANQLFCWDLATKSPVKLMQGRDLAGLSPQIAPSTQFTAHLWNVPIGGGAEGNDASVTQLVIEGKEKQLLLTSTRTDYQFCGPPSVSFDSRFVAAPMWQNGKNFIAVWRTSDGTELLRRPVQFLQKFVTFGPEDGQGIALASVYENSINKLQHAILWRLTLPQ